MQLTYPPGESQPRELSARHSQGATDLPSKGPNMPDEILNERYLAIKVVMMPRDTNPHGTIFGGVTLSYIDQAGAVGCGTRPAAAVGRITPLSPSP